MTYCPYCRGILEAGAQVCPSCGKPLPAPAAPIAGRPVNPGQYLRTGWELFKLYPGGFVGFTLIFLIFHGIVGNIPRVGALITLALSGPLTAGFFVVSAKLLQRRTPTFQDFFTGFQFFLPLLLLSLVSAILIGVGFILLIIPGVYLLVCYLFPTMIVVDRRLDFWPAMELSRRMVQTQWFGFFVFLLLLVLINIGGLLLLGIGVLISAPVSACALAAAYAEIFGLQSDYSGNIPQLK